MTKLITGGTGAIGAELAHLLVDRGEDVVLFDKFVTFNRISDIKDKTEVAQGDVSTLPQVLKVIKDYKVTDIYHMAGIIPYLSETNSSEAFQANVVGTYNLLEASCLLGVKRLVFTSTIGTYGLELGTEITDHTIQRPTTFYGVSKLFCEGLGRFYRHKFGFDFRSIRYAAVVVPGNTTPWHWYNNMIDYSTKGEPYECPVSDDTRVSLIYIKDAARAADLVLQTAPENIKNVNYNVSGVSLFTSAKEIEQTIKKYCPDAVIRYKPDDDVLANYKARSMINTFDDSCAEREWGWKPEYSTVDQIVSAFIKQRKA